MALNETEAEEGHASDDEEVLWEGLGGSTASATAPSRAAMARLDTEYDFEDGYQMPLDPVSRLRQCSSLEELRNIMRNEIDLPPTDAPVDPRWVHKRMMRFDLCAGYEVDDYNRSLQASYESVCQQGAIKHLWDTNPFLAPILGSSNSSDWFMSGPLKRMRVSGNQDLVVDKLLKVDAEASAILRDRHTFTRAVSRLKGLKWPESNDSERQKAISRWVTIIMKAPECSRLGRMLLADLAMGKEESESFNTVKDVLCKKATKTLIARSGSILLYFDYCREARLTPLPFTEEKAYGYVSFLKETAAAPTRASGFLSAMGFVLGSFCFDGAEEVRSSPRIAGSVMSQALNKRKTKQRRPFSVEELAWLEYLVTAAPDLTDRVFAGFILFLTYGRARNSDTRNCKAMFADFNNDDGLKGFIQVDAGETKTGRSLEKRQALIPLVAPRIGVRSSPWADYWIEARMLAGLPVSNEGGESFPLMPNPELSGGWGSRPLTSNEVRRWLGELLMIGDKNVSVEDVGSHSAKCTTLSWMAKIGAPAGVRKLLGYHIDAADVTMATYSRDIVAEPLRQLEKMLCAIRLGCFSPDLTRSGTTTGKLAEVGFVNWHSGLETRGHVGKAGSEADDELDTAWQMEQYDSDQEDEAVEVSNPEAVQANDSLKSQFEECPVQEAHEEATDGSSSSAESSAADVAVAQEAKGSEVCRAEDRQDLDLGMLYFHSIFTTVHKLAELDGAKFKCGRAVRSGYNKLDRISVSWPKCKICFPDSSQCD